MVDPGTGVDGNVPDSSGGSVLPDWLPTSEEGLEDLVLGWVVAWFVNQFVNPVINAFLDLFTIIIDAVILVFLGGDGELSASGLWGLADLPLVFASVVADAGAVPVTVGLDIISDVNGMVVGIAESAGIVGLPIATALWVGWTLLVTWVLWRIVEMVDIPVIQLGVTLKTLFAPVTAVWRWLT